MENISQEQILAFGALGFAIIGFTLLICLAVSAGTLKLSIAWLGKASPSYLACVGWLLAITFVNCFLVFGTWIVVGETAVMLVTPLTWFVTLYMVSTAANCGLIRAFGIWFVNSLLSGIGMTAILFAVSIPLAVIGAGAGAIADPLHADAQHSARENIDAMAAEIPSHSKPFDERSLPKIQEVNFQTFEQTEAETEAETETESIPKADPLPSPQVGAKRKERMEPVEGAERFERTDKSNSSRQRRASDGSVINPFFQD